MKMNCGMYKQVGRKIREWISMPKRKVIATWELTSDDAIPATFQNQFTRRVSQTRSQTSHERIKNEYNNFLSHTVYQYESSKSSYEAQSGSFIQCSKYSCILKSNSFFVPSICNSSTSHTALHYRRTTKSEHTTHPPPARNSPTIGIQDVYQEAQPYINIFCATSTRYIHWKSLRDGMAGVWTCRTGVGGGCKELEE